MTTTNQTTTTPPQHRYRSLIRLNFSEKEELVAIKLSVPATNLNDIDLSEYPFFWIQFMNASKLSSVDDQGSLRFTAELNLAAETFEDLDIDFSSLKLMRADA